MFKGTPPQTQGDRRTNDDNRNNLRGRRQHDNREDVRRRYAGQQHNSQFYHNRPQRRRKCFNCGSIDHLKTECRAPRRRLRKRTSNVTYIFQGEIKHLVIKL